MPLIKRVSRGTTKGIGAALLRESVLTDDPTQEMPLPTEDSAPPPPAAEEIHALPKDTLLQNRYSIEGMLGVGGMSVVYTGRDLRFKDVKRLCAIKEMYQRAPDSQTRMLNLRLFDREAGLLATLNHPAIPKIFDFFEENKHVYLVMELVPGKDLEAILEERGKPLEETTVGHWAIQICDVLQYLHNQDPVIIFRDMKPSNVLVTPENRIVLVDFGIARLLDPTKSKGTMIGTEGYAPPEQYRGVADQKGDLYALGAALHHLLTNHDPRQETPFTFQDRPIRKLNPLISESMEKIVMRLLEYNAEDRYSSAQEVKQALLTVLGGSGAFSVPYSGSEPQTAASAAAALANQNRASGAELIWKFQCEDEIRSSPCIYKGLLYVGCYDSNLYALDLAEGKFRWKFATEAGISSSPAIWEQNVIFGSEDGAVYSLNQNHGVRQWTFRTGGAIRSSPVIQDRLVFIGSDDNSFYAIDGMRGSEVWKFTTSLPFRSSACPSSDTVFTGCNDNFIYGFDIRNGKVKSKQRVQQPIVSTPACNDDLVFVGSLDTFFYALDKGSGYTVWRFRTGHSIISSPCVVGKRVFFGSADGGFYAVEIKTGKLAWKYEIEAQITSSPCEDSGRIYFGATDGCVYCLETNSGTLIWKYQTGAAVVSSPKVVEGVVYVGSMDHCVYALKA